MEKFGGDMPADPLLKTEVVAGLSDCFLTSSALRRHIEELETVAANTSLSANEKESARKRLLGEAVVANYGGCSLSLDMKGNEARIEGCIRPVEDCPLRNSAVENYGSIVSD